jgi:unsaturated rhamnogalacturonyl hydrolase
MRLCFAAMVIAGCVSGLSNAQQVQPESKATGMPANDPVLERALHEWPEGSITTVGHPGEWAYEQGTLLDGVTAVWRATGGCSAM